MVTPSHWADLRGGGGGGADGACTLDGLALPAPLEPLLPDSPFATLTAPLCLLGLVLLLASLLLSHLLSKTPISQLGQVGRRGRRHLAWNESVTGGPGGGFFDWWLFGGSAWLRAFHCIHDLLFDHGDGKGGDNSGGENLFACFGVSNQNGVRKGGVANGERDESCKSDMDPKHDGRSVGILGYDSSLGAHGPLILAPIRAAVFLLAWSSACSFFVLVHTELVAWLEGLEGAPSTPQQEKLALAALFVVQAIQSIVSAGEAVLGDIRAAASHTDPQLGLWLATIAYAAGFVALVELALLVLGKVAMILRIYVPRGVSHPGGPRPHKIVRMPQWSEGKKHFFPRELLLGDDDDIANSRWRCAVGHDAHRDTQAKFGKAGSSAKLTGEPFGRQMWTTMRATPASGKAETEDDLEATLRKELASTHQTNGTAKRKDSNIFSAIADIVSPKNENNEKKSFFKEDEPDVMGDIGEFIQTIISPNEKGRSHGRKRSRDEKRLIVDLASGGRSPALAYEPSENPNSCDQLFRAQMIASYLDRNGGRLPEDLAHLQKGGDKGNRSKTVLDAAKRGIAFYSMLQTSDGHFAGDYGGPHFLLPGLVVAWYVMGRPPAMISPAHQALMLHYLRAHQQADGGWGTHIESPSTMFGTVFCYLAVRLLGGRKDDGWVARGRAFIQKEGGAVLTSSWAKFWLCLLGCMDWKGHNSVPPEMWLLPNWFPFHPGRLWCHCRMVYLPMGYLYGSRFVYADAETDPLIAELRKEASYCLYCQPYESINWGSTRHLVASMDNYSPIPMVMKIAQNFLAVYENWSVFRPFRDAVRKAGLKYCAEYMKAEDLQTNYIDIGPVNKALNMVSAFHAANFDINDPAVQSHMMRVPDYLWVAEDGMKMQGYNGSQCWDTSFAIQAVWECGLLDRYPMLSAKVWAYLERTQILSTDTSQSSPAYQYESCDNRDKFYRQVQAHVSKGGWPFSTSAHGWPISDCTGEGLKGVLALMDSPIVASAVKRGILKDIEPTRLYDAVEVILTLQNEDGGWATYENNRGFGWYEELNPSEVFGDIMIDYSYVECSMASLTALADFHEKFPLHRTKETTFAIRRGAEFMKSIQREDGSWYGSWACCFCYGCWFGIEGLIKAGESHSSPAIQKCCQFLLSQQRPNGGWGEDFTSCYDKDYAENGMQSYGDDGSGVVNTAWALMALSAAKCSDVDAIRRGVRYLMNRQLDCGDWPQEGISGVFNRACGITYTAYRNVFPIWALGRCYATYGSTLDDATG